MNAVDEGDCKGYVDCARDSCAVLQIQGSKLGDELFDAPLQREEFRLGSHLDGGERGWEFGMARPTGRGTMLLQRLHGEVIVNCVLLQWGLHMPLECGAVWFVRCPATQ